MLPKLSKTQPLTQNFKTSEARKQYFDINRKKLKCFIQREDGRPETPELQKNQNFNQQKKPQIDNNLNKPQSRRNRVEDSPDISRKVVNDIIAKIQEQGLEFQSNDLKQNISRSSRSLSPQQHSFSVNNIWNSDWSSQALNKSVYSSENSFWTQSLKKFTQKAYPSTHRSSNVSLSTYQEPVYTNQSLNSFYYQQQPVWNMYQIVFDSIDVDSRTTVMIKNIPNKYSLAALSDEIDATHAGQYDFLYLPFDYTSKCNIGYAFINFLNPDSLKTFYKIYNLKKWRKFRSEKICELTYARLQGRSSLIDHFHSSKVFNQKGKNYRPVFKDCSQIKDIIAKQKQSNLNHTYLPTNF